MSPACCPRRSAGSSRCSALPPVNGKSRTCCFVAGTWRVIMSLFIWLLSSRTEKILRNRHEEVSQKLSGQLDDRSAPNQTPLQGKGPSFSKPPFIFFFFWVLLFNSKTFSFFLILFYNCSFTFPCYTFISQFGCRKFIICIV